MVRDQHGRVLSAAANATVARCKPVCALVSTSAGGYVRSSTGRFRGTAVAPYPRRVEWVAESYCAAVSIFDIETVGVLPAGYFTTLVQPRQANAHRVNTSAGDPSVLRPELLRRVASPSFTETEPVRRRSSVYVGDVG